MDSQLEKESQNESDSEGSLRAGGAIMFNRLPKESQNREGSLPASRSSMLRFPARKKIWTYDKDRAYWRLADVPTYSVRFKLRAGRHTTFERFLLAEHKEGDVRQLQNILQDVTFLHLEFFYRRIDLKWSYMFLKAIETAKNPARFLQHLACLSLDGKLDTLISRLQYLRDLRCLHLESNQTLNHFNLGQAMELGHLRALETLILPRTSLNASDCEVYANAFVSGELEGLRRIDFSDNEISDSGAATLARAIQSGHVKNLQEIDLGENKIGHDGMAALGSAFQSGHMQKLHKVKLGWNRIGDDGMVAIASAFQSGGVEGLSHIDFSANKISASGAAALARAFQSGHVKNLQEINLSGNRIGDDGMVALGSAFESGGVESLSHIDFSDNEISDSGVAALARAFQSGQVQKLHEVNLAGNRIGDEGIVQLATVLETGKLPKLNTLVLSYNSMRVTGITCLARALESGNLGSLRRLDLSNYAEDFTGEEFESLVQALSNNSSLTVRITTSFRQVDTQLERQRELNEQYVQLLSAAGVREVPARYGKIFLCGNPQVGKTTLRRSLERSKLKSVFMRETKKHEEPRTRGIDVCQISSKSGHGGKNALSWALCGSGGHKEKDALSLALWDVAGQYDYHMVHNAFLRDLASSKANATIFVVMCSSLTELSTAEKELETWFKFIASSVSPLAPKHRDVFVVINRIKGDLTIMGQGISNEWKGLLSAQATKFEDYLKVNKDPFIIDVRKRECVQHFKKTLIKRTEEILENVKVPDICDFIQNCLSDWVLRKEEFPVLPWNEVQSKLRERGKDWPEEILQIAFKYLNEVGTLIYVEKEFSQDWLIPKVQLVIANPTWLCKEILGNMFLSQEGRGTITNQLFRKKVNSTTGSISISEFKSHFRWSEFQTPNNSEKEHLLSILLWLGVCFPGHDQNIIIPALISADDDNRKKVQSSWNQRDTREYRKGQWVMGFSVEHVISQTALAPMALWHRFQVQLARTPKFNGAIGDENFVAGQYYVTFKVEYMSVLIQVIANEIEQPSFQSIEVLVKPFLNAKQDDVSMNTRKQRQVDIAGDIVRLLVDLWDEVCPGVGFVQWVVWPWPISMQRPEVIHEKIHNVAELKKKLEENGKGQAFQANVGEDDVVTWDQLLSRSDKKSLKNYVLTLHTPEEKVGKKFASAGSSNHLRFDLLEESLKESLKEINENVLEVKEGLLKSSQIFKDFEQTFFEDRERTCPKVMYLGTKNSSLCTKIKGLKASPITPLHLHFLCEAFYDEQGLGVHVVIDQEGVDVSYLKDWARKLAPWIKYSVLFLVTLAKVGSNFVIPGLGLAIPSFVDWQQALSLSDGFIAVTGYTEKQLDVLIKGKEESSLLSSPDELYGHSRNVMTEVLGKLTTQEYKEKLGLLKVRLRSKDGSLVGVRWICHDCLVKYKKAAGYDISELG